MTSTKLFWTSVILVGTAVASWAAEGAGPDYLKVKDLTPVIHVGTLEQVIAVNTSLPVRTIKELVDYAQANPAKLNWASLGVGSSGHLYMEWMQAKTGARFTHRSVHIRLARFWQSDDGGMEAA